MIKALNILGLLSNLTGIVLLFLFGIPLRVAISDKVPWTTSNIAIQVKKLDDLYGVFGWIGLLALLFGTLLLILATLERR